MIKFGGLVLLLCIFTASANGQFSDLDRSRLNTAAFYSYSEPGDITMRIHVWGAVRFSGLYEVPRDMKLSELLSLAGGPLLGERESRATRIVKVSLHRLIGGQREIVFHDKMINEIVVATEDPVLLDGDVLSMEAVNKQGFRWRDVFPIVTMVATLTLAFERINSK